MIEAIHRLSSEMHFATTEMDEVLLISLKQSLYMSMKYIKTIELHWVDRVNSLPGL